MEAGLAGLVVAALAALGIYARLIEPYWLKVKRLEIGDSRFGSGSPHSSVPDLQASVSGSPGAKPLTVCFFSDLHVGRFKRVAWVRKVVALANAQKPDAVLIGGDFVGHLDQHVLADLLAPLAELQAPLGVYAVLGNHDYGLPGSDHAPELIVLLRRLNVRLLRNECVMLDGRVRLIGVDDLWAELDNVDAAFNAGAEAGAVHGSASAMDASASAVHAASRTIVLGHNPDLMAGIQHCADLFLFGHTHGGQIYFPFLSRFIVPVDGDLYRGLHQLPQGMVYITNGCGETTTPTRLGARPEVVVVTVNA
jgi:predicted MPP superfamily phosphohydrolase